MFKIECPECGTKVFIEKDKMPDRACEDIEVECQICKHKFNVGWYAEIEYR